MSITSGLPMQITLEEGDLDDLWNDTFSNYTLDDDEQYTDSICTLDEGFKAMFIPVLYTIVFAVGVLGNGALLVVLVRTRRNWSVTDTFILHLCIADVLLLVTLPFWASEAVSEWTFGTPLCKITGAVFTINFYCGIFLLACISLDRYFSIVHATQMYSRRNPCVVQISCLSVWLFSMLLSIPDWIFLEALKDERRSNKIECMNNYLKFDAVQVWSLATRLLYHIVGFLLPSSVLIFCYSCILRRLRFGSHGLQKQRASRVIVVVVAVFFLCWLPYNITLMVDTLSSGGTNETCEERNTKEKAKIVTSCLGYLHCSLNPILYAFVGVKFRRQLLDILRALGCNIKARVSPQSGMSRKSSIWSESGDTSNSIAI